MRVKVTNRVKGYWHGKKPLKIYKGKKFYSRIEGNESFELEKGIYHFNGNHVQLKAIEALRELRESEIQTIIDNLGVERERPDWGKVKFVITPKEKFAIDSYKGVIYINPVILKQLPFEAQYFILLHEIAHKYFESEGKCDSFAVQIFKLKGHNRSQALLALAAVLDFDNPNHLKRFKNVKYQLYGK